MELEAIGDAFSREQFEDICKTQEERAVKAKALGKIIGNLLTNEMTPCMNQIIERLNSMGHDLRVYDEGECELNFRDDEGAGDNYFCRLRIGFDYIVSAAYNEIMTLEEAYREMGIE
jgi:hypothetical protein